MCLSVEPLIHLVNIHVHFVVFVIVITVIVTKINNKNTKIENTYLQMKTVKLPSIYMIEF